jgi:hypothetical protein
LPAGWTDLEWLVAVERIKHTQALYCFCLDAKYWDGYEALYAPQAVLKVAGEQLGDAPRRIEGAGEIRRFVEGVVGPVTTVHQCHTPVIDILSTQEAHVGWPWKTCCGFPMRRRSRRCTASGIVSSGCATPGTTGSLLTMCWRDSGWT